MLINKNSKIIIILIFTLLCLFNNFLFSQDNLREGIDAVKRGDYLKALPLLKEAVKDKKSFDANYYYSFALLKTGSLTDAEKYLKIVIDIDNERPEAYSVLGQVQTEQKKYIEAESNFSNARQYLPLNKPKEELTPDEIKLIVDVLFNEAENFIAENKPEKIDKAITSLSIAKTYDNNNPIILSGLGDAYYTRGALDLAKSNYEAAISANKDYAPAFYGLGKIAFIQKKYSDALDYFTKANDADPKFAEAYFYRGLILYLSDKLDIALVAFNKYIELRPGAAKGYIYEAKTLRDKGNFDEAMNAIDKALLIEPTNGTANEVKATIYSNLKDYPNAQKYFDQVKPEDLNGDDCIDIGKIKVNLKDFKSAYEYFQKAIAMDSTSEKAYFEYGKAQFSNQEYDASLINFDKAIALGLAQSNFGVYVYKGIAQYYLKDYDNAISSFQKSLDLSPTFATSWLWIGNCYAAMGGKKTEACNSYKKCLEIDANNQDAKDQIQKLGCQ